ncbi:ABC transporter permease [Acidobacteriota bacterium]
MLLNYLKSAIRNIRQTRLFSVINILGLAVGMAACLLILIYVRFEKSYDRFYENSDRIYRLRYERTSGDGQSVRFASCTPPAAGFIRGAYPEVEQIARLVKYRAIVSLKDRDIKFIEERMFYAEPDLFEIFDIPFKEGDPKEGLREAGTAFISMSTARKYFGQENPMGQTISVDAENDYRISGIFEDIPQNSHLKFDILLSYENLKAIYGPDVTESWGHTGFFTYLLMKSDADPAEFQAKMPALVEAQCKELMEYYKVLIELQMQPLTKIHLTSHFMQEYEINGNQGSVNILLLVALFIIVMAWVNYVNLSTARSLTRAREVGLRKIVGASRLQLVVQFFLETIVLNGVSVVLALVLLQGLLPVFSRIAGIGLTQGLWTAPWFWGYVFVMVLSGVFLSGLYPVAALSSFRPSTILRGKLGNTPRGINLRKVMVVFQFVIALALITATFTVYRQIGYMKSQNLGFDKDQMLVVHAPRVRDQNFGKKFETFREELLRQPPIQKMCVVTEVPGRQIYWDAGAIKREGEDAGKNKNYQIVGVGYNFLDVFDLKLAAGRTFSREFPADKGALLLNETAVKWMGFKSNEDAVGQNVDYWGDIYPIIGILTDYHQQSLKAEMEPHIYRFLPYGRGERGRFALKVSALNVKDTVKTVEDHFKKFFPGNPFEYFFLDDYFNQQYRADELFGKVVGIFAFLAMFVTALGIFGMSSFMSIQRTKEIGIRKVLGASVPGIMRLMMKEFLLLVGISVFIAWPLTYWGIRQWLNTYAFRMSPGILLFVQPLFLILVITVLTLGSNILRAALSDPVTAIQYE